MHVELIKDIFEFKAGTQFEVERSEFCDYTLYGDFYYGTVKVNDEDVEIRAEWKKCKHIRQDEFTGKVIPNPPERWPVKDNDSYINYP